MAHKRPRVMFALPGISGGGIEKVIYHLVNGLLDDLDMAVFTQVVLEEDSLLGKKNLPKSVVSFPAPSDLKITRHVYIAENAARMIRAIHSFQPELLITTYPSVHLLAGISLRLMNRRQVPRWLLVEHGDPRLYLGIDPFRASVKRMLVRWAAYRADGYAAVSRTVANRAMGLYPWAEFKVLYNPVVTSEFPVLASAKVAHPWFDGTVPVVLWVGRFASVKGLDVLARAFALVVHEIPDARLALLGDGDLKETVEALCHRLGIIENVWFGGFQSSPVSYMAKATLFVFPSFNEGQPLALIEAMAAGAAVIASDIEAIRECGTEPVIRLVPPGDVESLAAAMIELLRSPQQRASMSGRATSRAYAMFGSEAAITRYRNLIWSMLQAQAGSPSKTS